MKHLFIIGNGFDCYEHKLPTRYADFRSYILSRYPDADKYNDLIPESITMPDGDEVLDMEEVAGYITHIIDTCGGDTWNELEYYLGDSLFDVLHDDLEEVPWDGPDKETMHAIYNNEDRSYNMKQVFMYIKELFCDWVRDKLANLDFTGIRKENIFKVLSKGDGFLNFNYTETLEMVYGISDDKVCHIHGQVGDTQEKIFFGHGDEKAGPEWADSLGSESNFSELKRELKKDTLTASCKHMDFFEKMNELETIHSFGFGFAAVDMFYIEKIAERVDPNSVTWFLSSYDRNNTEKREKLENLGFHVAVDGRW